MYQSPVRDLLGNAYDGIPKSIFALMAYYLADRATGAGGDVHMIRRRLREEVQALQVRGIITKSEEHQALEWLASLR